MLTKEEGLYLHRMDVRQSIASLHNYERLLKCKDYENGFERMRRGAFIGMGIGTIGGIIQYLSLMPMSTMASAAFAVNILAKSATAGILYASSSTTSSVIRGNVDGPLNHLVSGFLTTLFVLKPPFIYRKIVIAAAIGLNTAFFKYICIAPKVQRYVENRHIEEGLRKRFARVNYCDLLNIPTEHRKKDKEYLEKYL